MFSRNRKKLHQRWAVRIPVGLALLALVGSIGAAAAGGSHLAPAAAARPAPSASAARGELDHLIPLELGGSSAAANLWPEIGPIPNPKDPVENALNHAVCSGRVSLRAAQRTIAADWMTAESVLAVASAPAPYRAAAPHRTTAPRAAASQPASAAAGRYRAGEYCSVHGSHTTDSHGRLLTCAYKNGWRWEH